MKHAISILALLAMHASVFAQTDLIKSVFFGGGSYYIDYQQVQEIREFVEAIPNIENYQVTISSHTDNIGGVEYNQWLSQMRSLSVIQQLEANKISPDRVGKIDNGQHNPLYDNKTWKGRMANRRVDIIFTPLLL